MAWRICRECIYFSNFSWGHAPRPPQHQLASCVVMHNNTQSLLHNLIMLPDHRLLYIAMPCKTLIYRYKLLQPLVLNPGNIPSYSMHCSNYNILATTRSYIATIASISASYLHYSQLATAFTNQLQHIAMSPTYYIQLYSYLTTAVTYCSQLFQIPSYYIQLLQLLHLATSYSYVLQAGMPRGYLALGIRVQRIPSDFKLVIICL